MSIQVLYIIITNVVYVILCVNRYSVFYLQAEDGIRDLVRSRGLGDVYKRQASLPVGQGLVCVPRHPGDDPVIVESWLWRSRAMSCLLYTSDAADERSSVDLGGRRIIKKKKQYNLKTPTQHSTPYLSRTATRLWYEQVMLTRANTPRGS